MLSGKEGERETMRDTTMPLDGTTSRDPATPARVSLFEIFRTVLLILSGALIGIFAFRVL